MKPITICFVYFRSLTLTNLEAALYSVRRQDLSEVEEIVFLDNNTDDPEETLFEMVEHFAFPVPVFFMSCKHGDMKKTHSWSTNVSVRLARTPWVFFTRADYLLSFDLLAKSFAVVRKHADDWDGFVTSNACHLMADMTACDRTSWRDNGPSVVCLNGHIYDYTNIDSGVWLGRTDTFERVGGLNERLTAWGHAQTHFQWKVYQTGTEFTRIEEVLFFHPAHGAEKDIELAHRQAADEGLSLPDMWARYEGMRMY